MILKTMGVSAVLWGPVRELVVFAQGEGHGYRIPAVVRTKGGGSWRFVSGG